MLPGYTWSNSSVTEYSERLSPSWWMVLAVFLVVPTSVLIFLPLSLFVGVATGLIFWLGVVGAMWFFSPAVTLSPHGFRAGPAFVEWDHVEAIEPITGDDARAEKSVRLDARAWLVLRPWVGPAVKVTLNDPDDPTPYWLVSTRRPETVVSTWQSLQKG